jgi:hypothetical protein
MQHPSGQAPLEDLPVPVRLKLSALWTSVMFCYVYGDIFFLFVPGKLEEMLAGKMPPFGQVTQGVLMFTSAMMVIPAVMIFLTLVLPARVSRWANIAVGILYSVIVLLTMIGSWPFYLFIGAIDVLLTLLIAWTAWTWPGVTSAVRS